MRSNLFRLFALLIIFSMVLSPLAGPANAQEAPETAKSTATKGTASSKLTFEEADVEFVRAQRDDSLKPAVKEPKGAAGPEIYLVRLEDAPVAGYTGGLAGLQATSPEVTGASGLSLTSPAVLAYTRYLDSKRAEFLGSAKAALQRDLKVVYPYRYANNGVAVVLSPEEAAKVAELPGVASVQRDVERELHTDAGPDWIGAPGLWDGSNDPGGIGTMGEGVIVGIIDTGINYSNPSFAATGPLDGYVHTNPLGSGTFLGDCAPGKPYTAYCNDKLIGVRGYPSVNTGDPVDLNGHGSHVAGTAAGNFVEAVVGTTEMTATISGVAPHANLIAYNACCTVSALSAAIEDIVKDYSAILAVKPDARMTVNYSIGSSGASDVWNDWDTVGYLNARAAGIFVATSAGNSGPGAATVGSPADAPWLTSVGNLTHNRTFGNDLIDMVGGETPPPDMEGRALAGSLPLTKIVYAGKYGDPLCPLGSFAPGTFSGEIVICDRGTFALVDKAQAVKNGGAAGFVVVNTPATSNNRVAVSYPLPGVHLSLEDGLTLKAWLATGEAGSHMAAIRGSYRVEDNALGDIMSASSSRGPNQALADILSPSISAPGSDILAPYGTGNAIYWDAISGTSMASPHIAGSAALLMALHPTWTPAEVQSALMTTAYESVRKENGVTPASPFDMGSGRVDLTKASKAGLVMNETKANYLAADPAKGGDPKSLNLPSMGNARCLQECTWTRTVKGTVDGVTWTATTSAAVGLGLSVQPESFTLNKGQSKVITITADVSALAKDVWTFGSVILTPDDEDIPAAHLPVGVKGSAGILPAAIDVVTRRDAGATVSEGLETIAIEDLWVDVYGLYRGDRDEQDLPVDPTNASPYDGAGGTFFITKEVEAGALWLIAEIISTTSPDLDLYVGRGSTPSSATRVCASANSSSAEKCVINKPMAGTWWVLVQNWEASAPGAEDPVDLSSVVVYPTEVGNMWVEGPVGPVPALTPYDLEVYWDEDAMEAGDKWYGGFSLGSDGDHPGNIGTIPVSVTRMADDVEKTADKEFVFPGDTVTYELEVRYNVTPEDLAYEIEDVLPAGLTYVPGSAAATTGTVFYEDGVIYWSGEMPAITPRWEMTTSKAKPATCKMPLANRGAYTNLKAYGINPISAISGDTIWFRAFATGAPFLYWGGSYTGIDFTDDGFAFFNSDPGGNPWINYPIPDEEVPNNLLAMYWNDWEVIYDLATTRGVSLVALGPTGAETGPLGGIFIEYDDVQFYGEPDQTLDFQMFMWRTPSLTRGSYDVMFAYDNINVDHFWGTIGIENADGTDGLEYAFDDERLYTLENGMAVCFDYYMPVPTSTKITYKATVDADAPEMMVNEATHSTDALGSKPAVTSAEVYLLGDLHKTAPESAYQGDTFTYDIHISLNDPLTEMAHLVDKLPAGLEFAGELTASYGDAWYDAEDHTVYWTNEDAEPGEEPSEVMISFKVLVTEDALGTVTNTAVLHYMETEVQASAETLIKKLSTVTFTYYDLESVVQEGEDVFLAGSFNGWSTTATKLVEVEDGVFEATLFLDNGTYTYKYVVFAGGAQWDWLQSNDRSAVVEGDTSVEDYRFIAPGYYVLQWPPSILIPPGGSTPNIYGQIWAKGLTAQNQAPRGLWAEFGYGEGTDPNDWTWDDMTWSSRQGDNAEYVFTPFTPPAVEATYFYAVRFEGNWGDGNPNQGWLYADLDWSDPAFDVTKAGVLDVMFVYDVALTAVEDHGYVLAGDSFVYTLTIENKGNVTDTFALSLSGNEWVTELAGLSFEVEAGDSKTVTVTVTAPAEAEDGDMDMVTVTAVSAGDEEVFAAVELKTHVVEKPVALFQAVDTAKVGEAVSFVNKSVGTAPLTYEWDFGGLGTSTEKDPSFTFTTAGLYTVKLTTTNDLGTDTFEKEILITPALPETDLSVEISVSPLPVKINRITTFTAVVYNDGPDTATGVKVSGTLPANVEFISGTNCSLVGSELTCDLGSIEAKTSKTAVVVLKFTATGSFNMGSVVVGTDVIELNPADNAASLEVLVENYMLFAPFVYR